MVGTIALIDADILVYRIGYTTEQEDQPLARWRLNEVIDRILYALGTTEYICYLTSQDKSNFRFELSDTYKANRQQPKPRHYQFLRDTLLTEHKAVNVKGMEADDAIGIEMNRGTDRVICSIDKDLDQLAGHHYNFVKDKHYYISPAEGEKWFYKQVLIGDAGDNVDGCPKIGNVRAARLIDPLSNSSDFLNCCIDCYQRAFEMDGLGLDKLWLAGNLLWIRRNPEEVDEGWTINSKAISKEMLLDIWNQRKSEPSTNKHELNTPYRNTKEPTSLTSNSQTTASS